MARSKSLKDVFYLLWIPKARQRRGSEPRSSLLFQESISLWSFWRGFYEHHKYIMSQRKTERPEDLLCLSCKMWNEVEKTCSRAIAGGLDEVFD